MKKSRAVTAGRLFRFASLTAVIVLLALVVAACLLSLLKAPDKDDETVQRKKIPELSIIRTSPGGRDYTVNNSNATFNLDLQHPDELGDRMFPSYAKAVEYARNQNAKVLPSTQALLNWCRHEDQELFKILSLGTAEWKSPVGLAARRKALLDLLEALLAEDHRADPEEFRHACAYVAGALLAGGVERQNLPAEIRKMAELRISRFKMASSRSKPIGVYSECPDLEAIFYQDRFLADGVRGGERYPGRIALAWVLLRNPRIAGAFDRINQFDQALTNPPGGIWNVSKLLRWRTVNGKEERLARYVDFAKTFPPNEDVDIAPICYAFSKEESILLNYWREVEKRGAMETIIEKIRDGTVDLTPTAHSGWYDYQWYALETMLLPEKSRERDKLFINSLYWAHLEESFKTGLSCARETQIKALPMIVMGLGGAESEKKEIVEVRPEFIVEPTPTVFLRQLQGYDFLLEALKKHTTADSPAVRRLVEMRNFFGGTYLQLCDDIGIAPEAEFAQLSELEKTAAKKAAAEVLETIWKHEAMLEDCRFSVPVYEEEHTGQLVNWGVAGVKLVPLTATFNKPPVVANVIPDFVDSRWYLPVSIFGEFKGNIENRQEWRKACDAMSQRQTREFLNLFNSPYFSNPHAWLFPSLGGVLVLAILFLGIAAVVFPTFYVCLKRMISYGISILGGILLLLFLLCALSSHVRTRLFCETLGRFGRNYRFYASRAFWRESLWNHPVAARYFVGLFDHPDPQIRYDALSIYGGVFDPLFFPSFPLSAVDAKKWLEVPRQEVHDKLKWVLENDTNLETKQMASYLLERFIQTEDMDWLIKYSAKLDGHFAIWHLGRFAGCPAARKALIRASNSIDERQVRSAIWVLSKINEPYALTAVLDRNDSPNNVQSWEQFIREQVIAVPLPEEGVGKRLPWETKLEREKDVECWDAPLMRVVRNSTFPEDLRLLAAERLNSAKSRIQALKCIIETSPAAICFRGLSATNQQAWLEIFKHLGERESVGSLANMKHSLCYQLEIHGKDKIPDWGLEMLVELATAPEMNKRQEQALLELGFQHMVPTTHICAQLLLLEPAKWRMLALLERCEIRNFDKIADLLEKTATPEGESP